MAVVNMVVGATTPDGATFVAKVDGDGPVRVAVADNEFMDDPVFTASQAVDGQDVAKVTITGLDADTGYWWQVEDDGVLDTGVTGRFRTHPLLGQPASFTVAAASCAGSVPQFPGEAGGELAADRVSNHPVFDTIRELDPLMFVHLGDLHYYDLGSGNHGIAGGGSLANYRTSFDDVFAQPRQGQLYREVPLGYVWDDHDFGPNDSDGTLATKDNAGQAYRERVPHYPLPGATTTIGCVQPGSSGNIASTPDTAVLDITGDIDLRADLTPVTWTPGTFVYALTKYTTTSNQRGYALRVNDAGELQLAWSNNGTAVLTATATALPAPDPVTGRLAVRATLDVNNGAAGRTITFYTAPSGVDGPWTQLGDPVVQAGTTAIFSNTAPLVCGGINAGTNTTTAGTWHAVQVRNGIDGTVVADADFTSETPGDTSFSDDAGRTWSVAGAAEIVSELAPIYQSWQIGRVLFVLSDTRTQRSPNTAPDGASKTVLGSQQKAWLDNLLATSDARMLVWFVPSQWLGETTDGWPNFTTERDELVQLLETRGWLDRMCMVYGDHHAAGICSGPHNPHGGFPILQAASLDSAFGDPFAGVFDVLPDSPGRNRYGTITVADSGTHLAVTLAAYAGTTELGSHTFAVDTPAAPAATSTLIAESVSGSHTALFEARVVTTFQAGSNPAGTEIPILGGDVQLDATANIHGTLSLTTDGNTLWPRRSTDLLAPYGNEVFVRRGIDLGDQGPLWIPLGYYRIETTDQADAPYGPITLTGADRMAGIVDARFLSPRQFLAGTTLHDVVVELVGEVHPAAQIVWDDATEFATLARDIVGEESRYELLYDIVTAAGKVMRWDGLGRLAIFTAPDPTVPLWHIRAGRDGVLIQASRALTRQGVYNAVVARGEGSDMDDPVQAVAVDLGPRSPTRWGGRFGQVPRFYSSPLIVTAAQASQAAREMLRRNLGMPYTVSLTAVANPAIRPWDPVRVTQQDGNRDLHLIQAVTIPLEAETALTGTTQEQTRVLIGEL